MANPLLGLIPPVATESALVSRQENSRCLAITIHKTSCARLIQNEGSGCVTLEPQMSAFAQLKDKCATLFRGRKLLASRIQTQVSFCLPKQVAGHLVWTRPWLLRATGPELHVIRWIQRTLSEEEPFSMLVLIMAGCPSPPPVARGHVAG